LDQSFTHSPILALFLSDTDLLCFIKYATIIIVLFLVGAGGSGFRSRVL
jgi:hypothetical protein